MNKIKRLIKAGIRRANDGYIFEKVSAYPKFKGS